MMAGFFHKGSGLGDQLHRYVTVRTLAEDKGYEWDMINNENFKGKSFMHHLTFPNIMPMDPIYKVWNEKDVRDEKGVDIRSYDPEINFVEPNTVIDGSFEDERYWGHNLNNINEWLKVEPLEVPDTTCVVGFRGGEYAQDKELFLTPAYYDKAMEVMVGKGVTDFEVHTDDPELARAYFPDLRVVDNKAISHSLHHNMGFNWRSARYAKYAIIPNSAFFIMPRQLRHNDGGAFTIAPRYWARRNTKTWARPACYYKAFTYL